LFSKAIPAHEIAGRMVKPRSKFAVLDHVLPPESETSLPKRKTG